MKMYIKILIGLVLVILAVMLINSYNAYKHTIEMADHAEQGHELLEREIESVRINFAIESVYKKNDNLNLIVKNSGRSDIKGHDLKVFIDEKPLSVSCDKDLSTGDVCEFELKETPFPEKGDRVTIKVTHPAGKEAEYVCAVTRDDQKVC